MRKTLSLTTVLLLSACAANDSFDFRSEDRPAYQRSVDANRLEALQQANDVTVLDVRLIEDFEADPELIPGAMYRNPDNIEQWSSALPQDTKVVVYCVKGRWVSQKAATFLRNKGYDVYSLTGGIEGWRTR